MFILSGAHKPLTEAANQWVFFNTSGVDVANFNLSSWTRVVSASNSYYGHCATVGGYVYGRRIGVGLPVRYAQTSYLATWYATATSGANANGLAATDSHIYLSSNSINMQRMTLPTSDPAAHGDASSRGNEIAYIDGVLYMAFSNDLYKSTNGGLSFTSASTDWMSPGSPLGAVGIASNGAGRIVLFGKNSNGPVYARYSDNGFSTISANKISDSGGGQTPVYGCLVWDGSHFVGVQYTGECWRSEDGETWIKSTIAVGGQTIGGISTGGGKVVVCGSNGLCAYSEDHGATWVNVTPTTGAASYSNSCFIAYQ